MTGIGVDVDAINDEALVDHLKAGTFTTIRKWTQTDLALRADVDRNYVSLIELGRNSPSVRLMFGLCDALDIAPSELLKDVERRMRLQAKASLSSVD
ncbi:helix-turn-helix domain-containing protein [Diaphorobacter sp. J5-51]|uniref:helix-turn-helix domain-containing protein n=1 Tax=Diaphorobacter sp. J5-51 TaxID=680496 RepID=UPI00350F4CE6